MKIWKLVLLVFCLFLLFGCVESGKENQKVIGKNENSEEEKQETEEKKRKQRKRKQNRKQKYPEKMHFTH